MKTYVMPGDPEFLELARKQPDKTNHPDEYGPHEAFFGIDHDDVRWVSEWRCVPRKRKYRLTLHREAVCLGWYATRELAEAAARQFEQKGKASS